MRRRFKLIGISCFLLGLVGCAAPAPTALPVVVSSPTPSATAAAATITAQPQATPAADDRLSAAQRTLLASLPSRGPAPELENDVWLNSEPLRLAELRGRVVLLDMWTFG